MSSNITSRAFFGIAVQGMKPLQQEFTGTGPAAVDAVDHIFIQRQNADQPWQVRGRPIARHIRLTRTNAAVQGNAAVGLPVTNFNLHVGYPFARAAEFAAFIAFMHPDHPGVQALQR